MSKKATQTASFHLGWITDKKINQHSIMPMTGLINPLEVPAGPGRTTGGIIPNLKKHPSERPLSKRLSRDG